MPKKSINGVINEKELLLISLFHSWILYHTLSRLAKTFHQWCNQQKTISFNLIVWLLNVVQYPLSTLANEHVDPYSGILRLGIKKNSLRGQNFLEFCVRKVCYFSVHSVQKIWRLWAKKFCGGICKSIIFRTPLK